MSDRGTQVLGKRRLTAIIMGITGVVAVLTLVGVLGFYVTTAHGSGTGGGTCVSSNGPACTFKGDSGYAEYGSISSDGCINTQAAVEPFSSLSRPNGTSSQSVFVFITRYDFCNNVDLLEASNFDPNTGNQLFTGTTQFGGALSSITVNGTATMYDWLTNTTFTSTINLTITGYGPTSKYSDMSHFRSPGWLQTARFTGTSRSAAVVSGTFTDNNGNNLAAAGSNDAGLENSSGGTVQIIRL